MGHSDISVTMNVYTHLGLDNSKDGMFRLEELNAVKEEEKSRQVRKCSRQFNKK